MRKAVELGPTAYLWLTRHRFVSGPVIVSVVQNSPTASRKYVDDDHFTISFRRKKNRRLVEITVWVEERTLTYFVYKIHSKRPD